jgi:hypothetical protein
MARVLAAGALVGLVLGVSGAGANPSSAQKCIYLVRFEGSAYHYMAAGVARGAPVGRGVRPGCNDTGGPPPPDKAVEVYRYGTASPRVALTVAESAQNLLVAVPGRCAGFGFSTGYRRCLQTEVRFRGRGYSAFRGRALPRGRALGRGFVGTRRVQLEALQGVDPRIALARRGRPLEALIAHRRCELQPFDALFMRCLRSPLWLRISPTGSLRSVAIERPGALVRKVVLRLFLAPDADADAITAPDDERLTPTGRLAVDAQGQGSTTIAIVDSVETGSYAVMAELPGERMVVVGALYVWKTRRRD